MRNILQVAVVLCAFYICTIQGQFDPIERAHILLDITAQNIVNKLKLQNINTTVKEVEDECLATGEQIVANLTQLVNSCDPIHTSPECATNIGQLLLQLETYLANETQLTAQCAAILSN